MWCSLYIQIISGYITIAPYGLISFGDPPKKKLYSIFRNEDFDTLHFWLYCGGDHHSGVTELFSLVWRGWSLHHPLTHWSSMIGWIISSHVEMGSVKLPYVFFGFGMTHDMVSEWHHIGCNTLVWKHMKSHHPRFHRTARLLDIFPLKIQNVAEIIASKPCQVPPTGEAPKLHCDGNSIFRIQKKQKIQCLWRHHPNFMCATWKLSVYYFQENPGGFSQNQIHQVIHKINTWTFT